VRGGDCRRLRQRRAQLRAKCGSAPLRRTVTERATRSTPNAFGVNGIVKKIKGYKAGKANHLLPFNVLISLTRRCRLRHGRRSRAHSFAFSPKNGV
jgi:hypothetical protein